jgi:hypothetical protein
LASSKAQANPKQSSFRKIFNLHHQTKYSSGHNQSNKPAESTNKQPTHSRTNSLTATIFFVLFACSISCENNDNRGMMSSMEMSSMVTTVGSEVTVYGAVGAVFLFLLVALLLGLSFSSPCKSGDNGKYLSNSSNLGYDRDQVNYK